MRVNPAGRVLSFLEKIEETAKGGVDRPTMREFFERHFENVEPDAICRMLFWLSKEIEVTREFLEKDGAMHPSFESALSYAETIITSFCLSQPIPNVSETVLIAFVGMRAAMPSEFGYSQNDYDDMETLICRLKEDIKTETDNIIKEGMSDIVEEIEEGMSLSKSFGIIPIGSKSSSIIGKAVLILSRLKNPETRKTLNELIRKYLEYSEKAYTQYQIYKDMPIVRWTFDIAKTVKELFLN